MIIRGSFPLFKNHFLKVDLFDSFNGLRLVPDRGYLRWGGDGEAVQQKISVFSVHQRPWLKF
jgi:hypothetical protein